MTYFADVVHVCAFVIYQFGIGEVHGMDASFLGAGLSPREVRTGYECTQLENCGFLC